MIPTLDLHKIPAAPDSLSPSRRHFSAVDDPTGSPPPEKMSPKLALVGSGSGEVLRKSSTSASILIVEDDKWLAEQYARVLRAAGYKVTISLHALAAIKAVDDVHPDAIILDVLLTGSTAFALLHELQSYSDTGKIPIILCTNLASELSVEDLVPYGVKQLLDKTTMVPGDLVAASKSVLP